MRTRCVYLYEGVVELENCMGWKYVSESGRIYVLGFVYVCINGVMYHAMFNSHNCILENDNPKHSQK